MLKKEQLTRVLLIVMAVVIAAMGTYILVDKITSDGAVGDENVELAISALRDKWKELYDECEQRPISQDSPISRYLEIYHTRVITVDPDRKQFSAYEDKKVESIVEFDLYSDRYGGAPCYINEAYYNTVLLFDDGSAEVMMANPLYTSVVRKLDVSAFDAIIEVKDYGTAFNRILPL